MAPGGDRRAKKRKLNSGNTIFQTPGSARGAELARREAAQFSALKGPQVPPPSNERMPPPMAATHRPEGDLPSLNGELLPASFDSFPNHSTLVYVCQMRKTTFS